MTVPLYYTVPDPGTLIRQTGESCRTAKQPMVPAEQTFPITQPELLPVAQRETVLMRLITGLILKKYRSPFLIQ